MVLQLFRCLTNCLSRRSQAVREGESPPESAPSRQPRHRGDAVPEGLRPLLAIPGIGPRTLGYLAKGGYTSVAEVRAASEEDLAAVDGVGARGALILKQGLSK